MTQWEKIYRDYRRGGKAWATLAEEVSPWLIDLIASRTFHFKRALDIGCGEGKYVVYLEKQGFKVQAIDSSPTAVKMAKQRASVGALIELADMYDYDYPENTFDLVISISTLHHGHKNQVGQLIDKIHHSLVDGGVALITLPDLTKAKEWQTFKNHQDLGNGTYAPLAGPEKGLMHSFYSKKEVKALFSKYKSVSLHLDEIGRWYITAHKKA